MKQTFGYLILSLLCMSGYSAAKVQQIANEAAFDQALKGTKNAVVEYSADWCSVCNNVKEPFEELSDEKEFADVGFMQVDVDKVDAVSKKNGVVGVPTFVFIEDGQKKVEEIGVQNMPKFKEHMRESLRKNFTLAQNEQPTSISDTQMEEIVVDTPAATPAAQEPNIIVRILDGIKNFFVALFMKVVGFFTTIIDAIKGFFGG